MQGGDLTFLFLVIGCTPGQQGVKGSLIGACGERFLFLKVKHKKDGFSSFLAGGVLGCSAWLLWSPSCDPKGSQDEDKANPRRMAECLVILVSS